MLKVLLKTKFSALVDAMINRGIASGKSKGQGMKIVFALLMVYAYGCLMFLFGGMFSSIREPFVTAQMPWLYFAVAGIVAFMLCFMGSIFMVQSQLYESKDNELLLSMPIRPSLILASRMVVILAINYLYQALVLLPAFVIWGMHEQITVKMVVCFVVGFLVLPLFVMFFSCICGWLLGLVMARVRRKNIIALVLSVGLMLLYFYGYSNVQKYLGLLIERGTDVAQAVKQVVFPLYCFGIAMASGDLFYLLLFVVCAVVLFALAYGLIAASFLKIIVGKRGAAQVKYVKRTLQVQTPVKALWKKELTHLGSSAMYIMNAGLGSLFAVVLMVMVLVKKDLIFEYIQMMGLPSAYIGGALCAAFALLSIMNFFSAPSISLEGKNLWIAKTIPVDYGQILLAKVYMHLTVALIPLAVSAAVCSVVLQVGVFSGILSVVFPGILTLAGGLFGVIVNLRFPRFDWLTEMAAVKQGMAVMITMFVSMGIVVLLIVLFVITSSFLSPEIYIVICSALMAIVSALMVHYLKTKGSRVFAEL